MGTGYDWIEVTRTSVSMMALVAFSVLSLGVVLERLYYYWRRGGSVDHTMEQVLRAVREGDLRGAARICRSCKHPMGAVGAQLLESGKFNEQEAEEPLQIALSEQKLLLERNLGILGTMAAVAPLVGLLGTVTGIMRAFNDMSVTGSGSPSVVAAGVAEALITTAIGIMIAVPVLMAYNAFARRMNVMLTIAENNSRALRAAVASGVTRRPGSRDTRDDLQRGDLRRGEDRITDSAADELELVR